MYLLFSSHGEALQTAGHVTQALLEGCHQVSLETYRETQMKCSVAGTLVFAEQTIKTGFKMVKKKNTVLFSLEYEK